VKIPSEQQAEISKIVARRERFRREVVKADEELKAMVARLAAAGFGPRPIARALGVSPVRGAQLLAAVGRAATNAPVPEALEEHASAPEAQESPRSASEDPMDVEPQSEAAPESSPVATSPADPKGGEPSMRSLHRKKPRIARKEEPLGPGEQLPLTF
jgi:hypothetical protein